MASLPRAGLSVPPKGLYLSLPRPGVPCHVLVAPLIRGRFVFPSHALRDAFGLAICKVGKPSRFVYRRRYGVELSVEVGLGWPGLYPGWGKLRLVISRSRLVPPSFETPLTWPVCWLWLVGSRSFLPPPPVASGGTVTATPHSLAGTLSARWLRLPTHLSLPLRFTLWSHLTLG